MNDTIKDLEDWQSKEKCRWVKIEIDDGYGATCWRVELHRSNKMVLCSEVNFGVDETDSTSYEHDGNLYCYVKHEDDWPGLEKTIRRAIECANEFWADS